MNTLVYGVVAVPAIIGVVTAFTNAGFPARFALLLDIVLGVGAGFAVIYGQAVTPSLPQGPIQAGFVGLSLGLSAGGVYDSAAKAGGFVANKIRPSEPTTSDQQLQSLANVILARKTPDVQANVTVEPPIPVTAEGKAL